MDKVCKKCGIEKELGDFYKHRGFRDGFHCNCKQCLSNYYKQYRLNNLNKIKTIKAKWRNNNQNKIKNYQMSVREHKREYDMQYRIKNKEKISEYKSFKWRNDINVRICNVLRTRLNQAIKMNFKSGSAVRDLGCSVAQFKKHLESKFMPGMTWQNWERHGWHIDHIKPLSKFDLTKRDEFLRACHYTNLQPLWAKDNLRKGNK